MLVGQEAWVRHLPINLRVCRIADRRGISQQQRRIKDHVQVREYNTIVQSYSERTWVSQNNEMNGADDTQQVVSLADSDERNATRAILLARLVQIYQSNVNIKGQCGGAAQTKGGFRKNESRISLRKQSRLREVPQTLVCESWLSQPDNI